MLLLALILILIDYFMSPVVLSVKRDVKGDANGDWIFTKLDSFDKVLSIDETCRVALKNYNKIVNDTQSAKACLNEASLVVIEYSYHKGILAIYKDKKLINIAENIQQPVVQHIGMDNEIYILEKGRERFLKFWQIKK